jgi:hypothetical protein
MDKAINKNGFPAVDCLIEQDFEKYKKIGKEKGHKGIIVGPHGKNAQKNCGP